MSIKVASGTPLPTKLGWWMTIVGILVAASMPLIVSGYHLFLTSQIVIYSTVLLGLNLLTGYNGQISLGHGALFGIGGYVAAILMASCHVPWWITPAISGVVCFVVGWLFGYPALRLKGHHLALATFALSLTFPQILKIDQLEFLTGGVAGLSIPPQEVPRWIPVSVDAWIYMYVLVVALIVFALCASLVFSQTGRVLLAIRDHPIAASAMGMSQEHYKTIVFGISSAIAGVGGALSSLTVHYVSPDSFVIGLSLMFLVGIVVGGLSTIEGAIFGAIFIVIVPNYTTVISESATAAVFAAVLLLILAVSPMGIADILRKGMLLVFGDRSGR
jgi:branched-chain amino acid transport system permease protein